MRAGPGPSYTAGICASAPGASRFTLGIRARRALVQLYGVKSVDPVTVGGVIAVLLVVALVACMIPALRALRIDLMAALRGD